MGEGESYKGEGTRKRWRVMDVSTMWIVVMVSRLYIRQNSSNFTC